MRLSNLVFAFGTMAALFLVGVPAYAADWSEWEIKNSVAREGDFLVIRQPGEGFCYVKQSYYAHPGKMELSMKADNKPFIPLPFFRGLDGDVTYWVDDRSIRIIRENKARNPLMLAEEVVPELKTGATLTVRVKPVGQPTREQRFSLRGFTAATRWLDTPECQQ